jgi:DNA-binding NtrC family response regulator
MCTAEGYRTQVRILVANWDRDYALSLAATMHRAGLTTITAFNGKEAVEKAETFRPHLLVTEAYLGRISGIHAAARITAAFPDCKVLFVSGEASFADIANAAPEGLVFSYARKPVHPANLFHAIAWMLSSQWPAGHSGSTRQDEVRPAARQCRVLGEQIAAASRNHVAGAMFQSALL